MDSIVNDCEILEDIDVKFEEVVSAVFFSEVQWWHGTGGTIKEICALHRAGTARFRVRMVVVLEMLALMVLMLMMHRAVAFAFRLRFPPQLLSSFAWCVVTLVVMRRNVSRSTVSIAHGKDDRRDDDVFRAFGGPSGALGWIRAPTMPCYLTKRAAFQHTVASVSKPVGR